MYVLRRAFVVSCLCAATGIPALAQETPSQLQLPVVSGTIEVTTTRVPEDVETVPASVTVISGEELRARGATDLGSALALASGVAVAPGGDGGPAGSIPELWGLREFDAFLLVVDGVPWGGAFNPALPALDLTDVDRIEIVRGAAPVMYGATSFSGVIQVIHRAAGTPGGTLRLGIGSYGSRSMAYTAPLLPGRGFKHSLVISGERQGFRDDRTGFDRTHVLYRSARTTRSGTFRLDIDGYIVRQDPASPSPRTGQVLSPLVPIDANQNPRGSKIDDDRLTLITGFERKLSNATWSTTLSVSHTNRSTGRGFLTDVSTNDPNANGYRQDLSLDDVYFDTHVVFSPHPDVQVVMGADHLYGKADQRSEDFDYFASLDGTQVPSLNDLPAQGRLRMQDTRNFSGLYLQTEWNPGPRWRVQIGARLNRTRESIDASTVELDTGSGDSGGDVRTFSRGSGVVGVSWLVWGGSDNAVWAYTDYRRTFKPAALDFGPDAEGEILKPETSHSYELGFKGRHGNGAFDWELSAFQMDLANLVVAKLTEGGQPGLTNAGKERFKGVELELDVRLASDLRWRTTVAWHDARFTDYERPFDGVPTRLDGNRLELSARTLASTGLVYSPSRGFHAVVLADRVGRRFLDMRNHSEAPAYTTWSATVGYRFTSWDLRIEGYNLNDTRPPVSESEVGDAQYYRLPARSIRVSFLKRF